jgi:hypothetical protein
MNQNAILIPAGISAPYSSFGDLGGAKPPPTAAGHQLALVHCNKIGFCNAAREPISLT